MTELQDFSKPNETGKFLPKLFVANLGIRCILFQSRRQLSNPLRPLSMPSRRGTSCFHKLSRQTYVGVLLIQGPCLLKIFAQMSRATCYAIDTPLWTLWSEEAEKSTFRVELVNKDVASATKIAFEEIAAIWSPLTHLTVFAVKRTKSPECNCRLLRLKEPSLGWVFRSDAHIVTYPTCIAALQLL